MPHENNPTSDPALGAVSSLAKPESNSEGEHHEDDARASTTEIDHHESETRTESESKKALNIAADSLRLEGWSIQVDEERSLVRTSCIGSNGTSFSAVVDVREDTHLLITYVLCPIKVPEGIKRSKVVEFLTRANYGIMIGNFELDYRDGEVRYKSGFEWADGVLTMAMVERLLQRCASTMNRYFPGIMKILYGDIQVLDAIQEIERPGEAVGVVEALAEALAVQVAVEDVEVVDDTEE